MGLQSTDFPLAFLLVHLYIVHLHAPTYYRKNTQNLKNPWEEHLFVRIKSGIRVQCSVKARDEQAGIIMLPAGGVPPS